jgi:hypothetical protein
LPSKTNLRDQIVTSKEAACSLLFPSEESNILFEVT